jgi:hypothetical protein
MILTVFNDRILLRFKLSNRFFIARLKNINNTCKMKELSGTFF